MNTEFTDQLLQENPDAVIAVSTSGVVRYWNDAAETAFGYSRADAVGRMFAELLVPDSRVDEERRIRDAAMQSEAPVYETVRRRNDGSFVHVIVSTRAIRNEAGEIRAVLHTEKDITCLKAMRDAKLAESRYRDLLDSAPDAMVMINMTGRIVLVNSQAEEVFGYGRADLVGKPVETLLPQRFRDLHLGHRARYFSQPRTRAMGAGLALYGLRSNGEEFPVEISLSPLKTEEGLFVSSAIRDVTERKRFEQEIQQANRMKSEFLANMSHELRTPLNGIIGFSELLADGKAGPISARQKDYLSDILNSGRHLLQLINDVLDLSKVEAGRTELFPETFALSGAVDEVCNVIGPAARKKGIAITHEIAPGVESVTLDQQKFKQALYNLLSNGVKFTEGGGRVEIIAGLHGAERLKLEVRDTGVGISPEDFGKLFVEFQQIHSGTARRYDGTGLGLALTRKIVELQGGTIGVESRPGHGSTFTVILPRQLNAARHPFPGVRPRRLDIASEA